MIDKTIFQNPHSPWGFKVLALLLLPLGVFISNFGWEPPEMLYIGDPTVWVVFAFLLAVTMWHQDSLNASHSSHWMFLPILGIYNGFTFGLAIVLCIAGHVSPNQAIFAMVFVGGSWGLYVISQKQSNPHGPELDSAKFKSSLLSLLGACALFVLIASGKIDVVIGGLVGFQLLNLTSLASQFDANPTEAKLRGGLFMAGSIMLIVYGYVN